MPSHEIPEGPMSWKEGEKPKFIMPWLGNVGRDRRVTLPGTRLAIALADLFNSRTGYCFAMNSTLAERSGVSPSAVKVGLQQLEEFGHIIRTERAVGGKKLRHIAPSWTNDPMGQGQRTRRGGVPQGTDPKVQKAEKAAAAEQPATIPAESSPIPDPIVVEATEPMLPVEHIFEDPAQIDDDPEEHFRQLAASDPNGQHLGIVKTMIEVELHALKIYCRPDRRYLTNAGAAAARAARARGAPECQTALNIDPGSASNFDPPDEYGGTPLISPAKRVGVAQPG